MFYVSSHSVNTAGYPSYVYMYIGASQHATKSRATLQVLSWFAGALNLSLADRVHVGRQLEQQVVNADI